MIFVKAVQVFWVFFQSSSQFSQVKAGHKSISILDVCFLNSFSPSQKDPKSCLLLSVVWYNFWFSDPNFLVGNCQIQEIIFGSLTPISCDRYQKKRGKAMAAGAVVSLVATTKIRLFFPPNKKVFENKVSSRHLIRVWHSGSLQTPDPLVILARSQSSRIVIIIIIISYIWQNGRLQNPESRP